MKRSLLSITALALLLGAPAAWQWTMNWRDSQHFPAAGLLVDVGGRRLHLLCAGKGAPVVVLEPSGIGSVLQYVSVQATLALDQRVCAYDRAGQGWSDSSPRVADARHLSDDLHELLRRSGEPPPYLFVASSAGGLTVELFAREHPDEVAGLVMVDALSANIVRALPEMRRLVRTTCLARFATWFGLPRMADPLGFRNQPSPQRERAIAATYRTGTFATACSLTRAFEASATQIEAAPPLRSDLPLVVLSHDDPAGIIPDLDEREMAALEPRWQSAQRELASEVSGAEFIIARSRHLIASEAPQTVIDAVRRVRAAAARVAANQPVPAR